MVELKDIRLSVSAMGEEVYIGKISKDGVRFTGQKKEFL